MQARMERGCEVQERCLRRDRVWWWKEAKEVLLQGSGSSVNSQSGMGRIGKGRRGVWICGESESEGVGEKERGEDREEAERRERERGGRESRPRAKQQTRKQEMEGKVRGEREKERKSRAEERRVQSAKVCSEV